MVDVAIFGCSGLGKMIQDVLVQAGRYRPVAYLDSDPRKHDRHIDGLPVIGGLESLPRVMQSGVAGLVVAIGDNRARVMIAEELERRGGRLIGAIHPLASISPSARIAEHVIIGPRAIICVNVVAGPHCIFAAGSIADHDTRIGAGCHLHPAARLAGGVQVDELATIEIGASVIPGRRIGRAARVAPGAVVIRDVDAGQVVAGVPAVSADTSRFTPDPRPTERSMTPVAPAPV